LIKDSTYRKPHSSFKLDGVFYDNTSLLSLAMVYVECNDDYLVSLGVFIQKWVDPNHEISLQTSGSTGVPKTFLMSKQSMVNSALATGSYFKLIPGDSALSCLPFNYIAAKMMFVRAYTLGLELDCINPSSTPLESLSKYYNFCAMVPLQLEKSIKFLHRIKTLIIGGAPLSTALMEKLKSSNSNVYETFGMTETVSHIAVKNISKSFSLFEVLPSISIAVDSQDRLLIEAPELASNTIKTNDLVHLHSKTTFEWVGRFDAVINSGGVKISPEQLEQQLEGLIKKRFFISSQKNAMLGSIVILVIESATTCELLDFTSIAPLKRPKHVYYVDNFIETLSGKVKRQETLALVKLV
jgi:o-succinylbenzoate---CoA ligase